MPSNLRKMADGHVGNPILSRREIGKSRSGPHQRTIVIPIFKKSTLERCLMASPEERTSSTLEIPPPRLRSLQTWLLNGAEWLMRQWSGFPARLSFDLGIQRFSRCGGLFELRALELPVQGKCPNSRGLDKEDVAALGPDHGV